MTGLYYAHSGLRYLILVVGIVGIIYAVLAIIDSRPHDKRMTALGAAFAGLIHLQVILGLGLLFMGRYSPAVIGHIFATIFAAVLAQLPASINRRRPRAQRGLWSHVICSTLALLLIAGGILAIGRMPWGSVGL